MKLAKSAKVSSLRQGSAAPALILLALLAVALGFTAPHALSQPSIINILNQQVSLILVTMGQVLVVLTAGLDLSVGSVVSMTTAIVSYDHPLAVPAALGAALCVGLVNGLGVTRFGVHPILMTLSTMTAVQGVALLIRPIPGGRTPDWMETYSETSVAGVPLAVIVMAALVALTAVYIFQSRFGLHLLAVGASKENALLGGVNVNRIILTAYVASSLFACLGGLNLAARIASGDPLIGAGFAIDSIAATALGGVQLAGGIGSVIGPVAGVLFLALLQSGLNLLNISVYYQMIIKGALLILAVSAYRRRFPGL